MGIAKKMAEKAIADKAGKSGGSGGPGEAKGGRSMPDMENAGVSRVGTEDGDKGGSASEEVDKNGPEGLGDGGQGGGPGGPGENAGGADAGGQDGDSGDSAGKDGSGKDSGKNDGKSDSGKKDGTGTDSASKKDKKGAGAAKKEVSAADEMNKQGGGIVPGGPGGGKDKNESPMKKIQKLMKLAQLAMAAQRAMAMMQFMMFLKWLLQQLMALIQAVVQTVMSIIMAVINVLVQVAVMAGIAAMTVLTGGIFAVVLAIVVLISSLVSAWQSSTVGSKEDIDPCAEVLSWSMGEGEPTSKVETLAVVYVALRSANPEYDQYSVAAVAGNFQGESGLMPARMEESNTYGYGINSDEGWDDLITDTTGDRYKAWLAACDKCDCQCGWWGWDSNRSTGSWVMTSGYGSSPGHRNTANADSVISGKTPVHSGTFLSETASGVAKTGTCPHGYTHTTETDYHTSRSDSGDRGIQCYNQRTRTCYVDESGHHWNPWGPWTPHHAYHIRGLQVGCLRQGTVYTTNDGVTHTHTGRYYYKTSGSFGGYFNFNYGYRGIGLGQWSFERARKLIMFAYGSASLVYNRRTDDIWTRKDEPPTCVVPLYAPVNGKAMQWYTPELQMAFLLNQKTSPDNTSEGSDAVFAKTTFPTMTTADIVHRVGSGYSDDLNGLTAAWMKLWERPGTFPGSLPVRQANANALLTDYIAEWYDHGDTGFPSGITMSLGTDILTMAAETAEVAANLGSGTNRNGCSTSVAANNSDIAVAAVSFAWPHNYAPAAGTCSVGHTATLGTAKNNTGTPLFNCVVNLCFGSWIGDNTLACTYSAGSAMMWSGAVDFPLSAGVSGVGGGMEKQILTSDNFIPVDWNKDPNNLQPGDVLFNNHHVILYVGHDTIVQVYGSDPKYACAVANDALDVVGASVGTGNSTVPGGGGRSAGFEKISQAVTATGTDNVYRVYRCIGRHPNEVYVGGCKEGYSAGY